MLPINRLFLTVLALSSGLTSIANAQTGTFTSMSMASFGPIVSPNSIASGFGTNLATATTSVMALPLGTTLGNVTVTITDSSGAKIAAPLYMVSASQINYLVPGNTALGKAMVTVAGASAATGTLLVSNIAPAIATANNNGQGVPAAQVLRITAAGVSSMSSPFMATGATFTAAPIALTASPTDKVYLVLYGTGIRNHSLNPVKATIGGVSVPVLFAGAQSQFPGLDQVNLGPLPQTLAGKGSVNIVFSVDGVPANTVAITVQ